MNRSKQVIAAAAATLLVINMLTASGSVAVAQASRTTDSLVSAQQNSPIVPYRDPLLPIDRRVDDLVSRMTPEEKASQFVHNSPAIPRLGIPAYNWWSEGLHGVGGSANVTVFPQAIGL